MLEFSHKTLNEIIYRVVGEQVSVAVSEKAHA